MLARPKPRALLCDIDETLCTEFSLPIAAGCEALRRLPAGLAVFYVTARTEVSRPGTERFIAGQRLPGRGGVCYCPAWRSSLAHKRETARRLARDYEIIAVIGDADEDEAMAREIGAPFVRVSDSTAAEDWAAAARLFVLG